MSTLLPETFDPAGTQGNTWDLLPVDEYLATIVEIAVTQPRSGNGHNVAITWKIDEGDYAGRQVWQRITYVHSSEQAQKIGRKQLKDLTEATGMSGELVEDVEVFLFKRAKIKVGIEHDNNGVYDDKNKVMRILPLESQPAVAKSPTATVKPQPKPQAQLKPGPAKTAPWHTDGGRRV
jgi:hypothetical protein